MTKTLKSIHPYTQVLKGMKIRSLSQPFLMLPISVSTIAEKRFSTENCLCTHPFPAKPLK